MCGIAGIINKTPRAFDYSAFCVLGIANDSRGGDSCGVFIDGEYEYGVDKEKFFSSYFLGSDFLYNIDRASIALLHCRKASVGKISAETAQPVVITDEYGNVEFVLMHNGTIHNYEELAKKYIPEVDITGMTDSQVMAHIFYNVGYESLNEYNGGAVFAIVDYRGYNPKVMLFKGASTRTKYTREVEEERPLYYCVDKIKRELLFSSIGIQLCALRKELDVLPLKPNTLFEFDGKDLAVVKYYSRENAFQQKEYNYYNSKNSTYHNELQLCDGSYPSEFIKPDINSNTYSFREKKLHGKVYLSCYGKIESSFKKVPKNYEVYFFYGIALKNIYCWRFLSALQKETKLSDADFLRKFENVIRFLSIDQVYMRNGFCYKCISPIGSVLFNGELSPLCSIATYKYVAGQLASTLYTGSFSYIGDITSKKHDINFKAIREECKSLMK